MKMPGFLTLVWLTAACLHAADDKWVATWGAAPLATNPPAAGAQPAPGDQPLRGFQNQTIRMLVNTSIGGRMARVELTNHFGQKPLKIGAAHVALHASGSKIVPGSDRILTFGGNPAPAIPPGASMVSDPVDLAVPAIGQLAVSLFLPEDTGPPTQHVRGLHTTYIAGPGDLTGAPEIVNAQLTTTSWYFLSAVHTTTSVDTKVLVTFGDSITDGSTSSVDANANWPNQLARRLHEAGMKVAVVNAGIGGNRVLADGTGVSALARFERDVLSVPGVTHLVFMEAINDIGVTSRAGQTPVTAAEIIGIYRQMVDRAHMRGIKVYGATLTPYDGAAYFSEGGEITRTTLNQWIRTTGLTDGVIDFDAVIRDPASPRKFRRDYTNTDFLHPNDAGYKAMADSIDLGLFK